MKRLALIVSGDRNATKAEDVKLRWVAVLARTFRELLEVYDDVVLLHGACGLDAADGDRPESGEMKGVDHIADALGRRYGFTVVPMPAPWKRVGRTAGPLRNAEMSCVQSALFNVGYDRLTVGCHDDLPEGKGTRNMMDLSMRKGVETRHLTSDGKTSTLPGPRAIREGAAD